MERVSFRGFIELMKESTIYEIRAGEEGAILKVYGEEGGFTEYLSPNPEDFTAGEWKGFVEAVVTEIGNKYK